MRSALYPNPTRSAYAWASSISVMSARPMFSEMPMMNAFSSSTLETTFASMVVAPSTRCIARQRRSPITIWNLSPAGRTTIGWSWPTERNWAASSSSFASSKNLRGWSGLGSMSASGIAMTSMFASLTFMSLTPRTLGLAGGVPVR